MADVERWDFKGRLIDVFDVTDAQIRGDVKQVVDFRNWVAHGWHTQKPAPSNITAEDAYGRLTKFLRVAGIMPP